MNALSCLLLLVVALSCLDLSHSACYMKVNETTHTYYDYCDTVSVNTITQDSNGDTAVSAVMGGDANSDCNTMTKTTIDGAAYAYNASDATIFSFVDVNQANKDSELVDFASNTVNNAAYKEACENNSAVNGTYVELSYEAICTSKTQEGKTVYLYVYDQPRCYAKGCSANDPVPFNTYTIEPTVVRNHNDWSCLGDLNEDYDRCGIYQKRLDTQVDNSETLILVDEMFFFGLMKIKDRKTVIPKESETFKSSCATSNGSMNYLNGIVKCVKDGASVVFSLDGSFSVCRHEICDTEGDLLSYFQNAMVDAGEIGAGYVCVSSNDTGENWFRDNSHLIAIGLTIVLVIICIFSCMINREGDSNAPGLPTHKKGISSL